MRKLMATIKQSIWNQQTPGKTNLLDAYKTLLSDILDARNTVFKINCILIFPALLPALERADWYKYNVVVPSDHRTGFLDFNSSLLFLNEITNIIHPAPRKPR